MGGEVEFVMGFRGLAKGDAEGVAVYRGEGSWCAGEGGRREGIRLFDLGDY